MLSIMTKIHFDGKNAFKYLEHMAVHIGTRPSGSEEEKKAAEWIESEFKAMGLKTEIQEFEVTSGKVISQKIEVQEPYNEIVPCEVMPLSGSTGPDGVTGELIYLESASEEYLTDEVKGKILITSGRSKDRKKAYKFLSKYPPLAMITIETSPRVLAKNLWGSAMNREKYGNLPALRIAYMDGLKLLESGAKKLHVIAHTESKKVKSQNVIAELPGSSKPEEIIIVGGHYDSVLETEGAGDNAAGTAIAMELARVYKERGTKRTIRFAAWGCEEMGLLGSRAYATRLREDSEKVKKDDKEAESELDNVRLCINLDVHGAFIGSNGARAMGPPSLITSVSLLANEIGMVVTPNEGVYSSDGTSISAIGVPSVSFGRGGPTNQFMHSIEDSMRWLKPEALQIQGNFIETWMTRYVADAVVFPFERKIPDKFKKEIEKYFKRSGRGLP